MVACTWISDPVVTFAVGIATVEGLSPIVWVGSPWCRNFSFMR
jgi:hypothetical protein